VSSVVTVQGIGFELHGRRSDDLQPVQVGVPGSEVYPVGVGHRIELPDDMEGRIGGPVLRASTWPRLPIPTR
jgi:hypothetical protein